MAKKKGDKANCLPNGRYNDHAHKGRPGPSSRAKNESAADFIQDTTARERAKEAVLCPI